MIEEKINELEEVIKSRYSNIAGIVVQKNGEKVYESYFNNCSATSRIHVYSVTKSVMSILVGVALDKGHIRSVNQKLLEFFPEYEVRKNERTLQQITLKDVLTMTAPYKYLIPPYIKYFTSDDWMTFTLDLLGGRGKIGKFRYTPLIGPDIFSAIIEKTTGQSVFEFATEQLFSPLKLTVEKSLILESKEEQLAFNKATTISGWVADSIGLNAGGWGLTLSATVMAKIGQLYLDNGSWQGKQIVSSQWVAESTMEHSRWRKHNLAYGYLWWLNETGFAAMGDGGNVIYVNTEKKIVVSIASLFKQQAKDRTELIQRYLEPFVEEYL